MNNILPGVTVVIPIRNEERRIAECLESLIDQSYPHDRMEILLMDGHSVDQTRLVAKKFCERYPFIRLMDNPKKIVPVALNLGIHAASGEIIIRMDAHTYYDRDYVAKCVETLMRFDAQNVGGPIQTLPGNETPIAKAIALATSHPFGVGNSKFRTESKAQYVDTVPFGAFRRSLFEEIGYFNEKLERNQDIEFNSRIIQAGGRIFLNPEIKSFYYNQSTLRGLWRHNFKNGLWNIFTFSLNRGSLSWRHFVPLVFILSLLTMLILSLGSRWGIAGFVLILLSYLFASSYFSFRIATSWTLSMILLLPLVFATLHFSYGFGSLVGLVRLNRWKKGLRKESNGGLGTN
ncbi:MAG: glycosyltransferase family 2 protein [Terriglobia bacterium]